MTLQYLVYEVYHSIFTLFVFYLHHEVLTCTLSNNGRLCDHFGYTLEPCLHVLPTAGPDSHMTQITHAHTHNPSPHTINAEGHMCNTCCIT